MTDSRIDPGRRKTDTEAFLFIVVALTGCAIGGVLWIAIAIRLVLFDRLP